ncbi:hypothetical protein [Anabaena catenula]|uniref:Uncharacterized protein n=1 Tax=Anabaena catenula FACHB-362 TaxID=2692877 RepID=A0ABR8IZY3_9NOST|nr:hypothetical protein [Anabaena catenula]MBD2690903.1 hypothetical protein [Anabaena catenula FACHB-362]
MQKDCLPSDSNAGNISCTLYGSCSHSRYITQLQQQFEQLQKQFKDLKKEQESFKIQMGHCSANLNRLGISTDPGSLEAYNEYSCGNHYSW